MDATELLRDIPLMPVVVIDDAKAAVPLAEALLAAGVAAIEITLRTDAALTAMEHIASQVPELLVGAGSVRQAAQFEQIKNAGAVFAVSPGATDALLAAANMPYVPGIATPSESLRLLQAGYMLQKFFPAEINGGAAALKALSAPIPEVKFCPTGGINAQNLASYLALGCVSCIGGSWFINKQALQDKQYAQIQAEAEQALGLVRG